MYKALIRLMDDMQPIMSRKDYYAALDDICNSEHNILKYLCDGITMIMRHKTNTESYKKLVANAIKGMKNINSYCNKYNHDAIFYFNESDEKSILKNASNFEDSLRAYTLENLFPAFS